MNKLPWGCNHTHIYITKAFLGDFWDCKKEWSANTTEAKSKSEYTVLNTSSVWNKRTLGHKPYWYPQLAKKTIWLLILTTPASHFFEENIETTHILLEENTGATYRYSRKITAKIYEIIRSYKLCGNSLICWVQFCRCIF
jgi:hypothetical protein